MKKKFFVQIIVTCAMLSCGCVQSLVKPDYEPAEEVDITYPVSLKLHATPRTDVVAYHSSTYSRTFEEGILRHEKTEEMDFEVQSKYIGAEPKSGYVKMTTTTLKKDGPMDLHEMAFPDVGEELEMEFTELGVVKKASGYPANSIFFVPPVPYPEKPVQKGDTWTMSAQWVGIKNSLPLRLDLTSILKRFVKYKSETCADIEVSGEVRFVEGVLPQAPAFQSELTGHFYVSVLSGSVLWQNLQSDEQLKMPPVEVKVRSILTAKKQ
jgi:hypothetical protein